MHRSRIDAILKPLRRYLRYGCNGPCFVRFRDRLVIQTCQNVEKYHRNGLSGTLQGVPYPNWGSAMGWPSPCVCEARPWPSSPVGGLGGRPGIVGSSFWVYSFGFRGFSRSTEVV